ncbi:hypothetical protein NG799_19625 [Laspinema sp. D1]|uniref:Uncharacterized protein n=1 Tax=Laspinema palackyanum D2a TaxID=2953684 RepID=A0ABT2MVI0_9CYAN|nr:hypothetical protein [Laspinema sp. D2a]
MDFSIFRLKLRKLLVYLPFIVYYMGVGFFLYPLFLIMTGFSRKIKLDFKDVLIITLILIFSVIKLAFSGVYMGLLVGMYSFGFIVYYVYFKSLNNYNFFNLRKLLLYLSLLTIAEAFLVNTFVPVDFLPNYPDPNIASVRTAFFGFYQRPYGFCGQPSVTSSVLVSLMSLQEDNIKIQNNKQKLANILPIIAILLCVSGTGYLALCILFMLRKFKNFSLFIMFTPVLLGIYYVIASYFEQLEKGILITKISPWYILFLWNLKFTQFFESYNLSDSDGIFRIWFGNIFTNRENTPIGSDFGWTNFFSVSGILGLVIIITTIVTHLNERNYKAILILVITTFHYATIFHIVGQSVFAYALCLKKDPIKKM